MQKEWDIKLFTTNKSRLMKILLLFQLFVCISINCKSQVYIGENNFGKLVILNDTTCNLNFIMANGTVISNDYLCTTNKDTLFISSIESTPLLIKYSESKYSRIKGLPMLIKLYRCEKDKYQLMIEGCFGTYDTLLNKLFIQDIEVKIGDIIVVKDGPFYRRFKVDSEYNKKTNSIIIDFSNSNIFDLPYLRKFPLLIKNKKLIPCGSKKELKECWLNNGFYFPKMRKRYTKFDFNTIPLWSIGLQDLSYFNVE